MDELKNDKRIADLQTDVDEQAIELDEPMTLMNLLSDELDDIYSLLQEIKQAESQADADSKKRYLASYLSTRIDTMMNLNAVSIKLTNERQQMLLELAKIDE